MDDEDDLYVRRAEALLMTKPWTLRDYNEVGNPSYPTEFRLKGPILDSHLESLKRVVQGVEYARLETFNEENVEKYKVCVRCPTADCFVVTMIKLNLRINSAGLRQIVAFEG